jgi:hypothetical protein
VCAGQPATASLSSAASEHRVKDAATGEPFRGSRSAVDAPCRSAHSARCDSQALRPHSGTRDRRWRTADAAKPKLTPPQIPPKSDDFRGARRRDQGTAFDQSLPRSRLPGRSRPPATQSGASSTTAATHFSPADPDSRALGSVRPSPGWWIYSIRLGRRSVSRGAPHPVHLSDPGVRLFTSLISPRRPVVLKRRAAD